MSSPQKVIAVAGLVLIGTALIGSAVRGRYKAWWFLTVYLVGALAMEVPLQVAPERFFTAEFWQAKETAYAALRFAVASELGIRTLRAFPGAFATARRIVLLVLLVTFGAVALSSADPEYQNFLGEVVPRVLNGSLWMLMTLAAVILWYRIPIQRFHKAVLLTYIPYILVSMIVAKLIASGRGGQAMQYVGQLTYVALMAYWNYAIWRPDSDMRVRPARSGSA
jgi:hypothetical protein